MSSGDLQATCKAAVMALSQHARSVRRECTPNFSKLWQQARDAKSFVYIPYVPMLWRPGWLLRYIFGPFDNVWFSGVYGDLVAGITVAMTLIPQGLSYSALAGLSPVNGLYASIVPSLVYVVLGSSMQLAVGPVALVSLLLGALVSKYNIDSANDPEEALDFSAQASVVCGFILLALGMLNLGELIRFVSYPVMVGFTTAAAMIIGLSQIKNVFGFGSEVPNIGAHNGVEYNWEQMRWYYNNWNDYVNPQAARIAFGVYVPLFAIWVVRKYFPTTPQRKQSVLFRFWDFFSVCATLFAIIFAAMATRNLVREHGDLPDVKRLDFVGAVPSGLNILRVPHFRWPLRQFILDLLPLTIVAYMESYAVARKTGQKYGFLSLLNASQELVALGVGNILGCLASGYPVAGSFSRSALNATTGAVSPLSKAITSVVVCLALGTLTGTFYWIPNAALGGVVWIAILNLLDPLEFWKAWMFSKKDFFVMFATFMFTFLCSSEIGLGIGLGMSIVILLRDLAFGLHGRPVSKQLEHEGVDVIRLNSNLVFVSATRIKDTLLLELFMKYRSDNNPLKAVVIDFVDVKYVDLSGLLAMYDIMVEAKEKGIVFVTANVAPDVQAIMDKMGIVNDTITDLKLYHHVTTAAAMIGTAGETDKRLEMECLASVTCILSEDEPHSGANEELKHLV